MTKRETLRKMAEQNIALCNGILEKLEETEKNAVILDEDGDEYDFLKELGVRHASVGKRSVILTTSELDIVFYNREAFYNRERK